MFRVFQEFLCNDLCWGCAVSSFISITPLFWHSRCSSCLWLTTQGHLAKKLNLDQAFPQQSIIQHILCTLDYFWLFLITVYLPIAELEGKIIVAVTTLKSCPTVLQTTVQCFTVCLTFKLLDALINRTSGIIFHSLICTCRNTASPMLPFVLINAMLFLSLSTRLRYLNYLLVLIFMLSYVFHLAVIFYMKDPQYYQPPTYCSWE